MVPVIEQLPLRQFAVVEIAGSERRAIRISENFALVSSIEPERIAELIDLRQTPLVVVADRQPKQDDPQAVALFAAWYEMECTARLW